MLTLFRDMRLSRKFAVAFGAVCLLCVLQGSAALLGFMKVNTTIGSFVDNTVPSVRLLGEIRFSAATIRRACW